MIRQLFKVERGTIVHFLKWGVALLAFISMLWLAFTLLMRPGVARTTDGPLASWPTDRVGPVPTRPSPLTPITREYVRRPEIARSNRGGETSDRTGAPPVRDLSVVRGNGSWSG